VEKTRQFLEVGIKHGKTYVTSKKVNSGVPIKLYLIKNILGRGVARIF